MKKKTIFCSIPFFELRKDTDKIKMRSFPNLWLPQWDIKDSSPYSHLHKVRISAKMQIDQLNALRRIRAHSHFRSVQIEVQILRITNSFHLKLISPKRRRFELRGAVGNKKYFSESSFQSHADKQHSDAQLKEVEVTSINAKAFIQIELLRSICLIP